ncbi:potassium channel family protein [Cryptosporangium arvum]|uniref:K+ transport system, NAD-binding component n=1 Tax=Cryptosporangium arvum DSM 44712 TaxID=927661 RepID=A0A010Z6P6_9ACTN|nr:TrkA family potassium uptake protein [Cryptosporangium arvum]EXG82983.1 K+ transport system, NAD-binding component [Cryptosporangium arvum DSM 44712]
MAERKKSKTEAGSDNVVVIGLGRFGGQVAESLLFLGHEVMGVDENTRIVQQWSDRLTHVVQADSTDEDALTQVGIREFSRAVVGIGTDIEASVLTVLTLSELGMPEIWAKAISVKHGKILTSVGADHVIYPEATMGERVARLIASRLLDLVDLGDGDAIATVRPPEDAIGRTITDLGVRTTYGVTIVGIKTPGAGIEWATPQTVVPDGCALIVSGSIDQVQRFATA